MNLITTGLENFETSKKCVPLDTWLNFAAFFTVLDMIVTMLLPFLLISITNTLITVKLLGLTLSDYKAKILKRKQKGLESALASIEQNQNLTENIDKFVCYLEKKEAPLNVYNKIDLFSNISTFKPTESKMKLSSKGFFLKTKEEEKKPPFISELSFKTDIKLDSKIMSNITNREKIYSRTTKVLLSLSTMFLILVRFYVILLLTTFSSFSF